MMESTSMRNEYHVSTLGGASGTAPLQYLLAGISSLDKRMAELKLALEKYVYFFNLMHSDICVWMTRIKLHIFYAFFALWVDDNARGF